MLFVLVIIFIFYFYYFRTESFNQKVPLNKEKISSIEIEHNNQKVILEENGDIREFINTLSSMEVRKGKASSGGTNGSYWIRVLIKPKEWYGNHKERYGFIIYGTQSVDVYNFSNRKSTEYKIVDHKNLNWENYFGE
ncbi:hypothetical protein ACT6P6_10550 [Priestia endophytica]|uniref:hypothetical protein n=1 Tax=Priestia filamentosa TaxID=1402861 RepID=UPI002E1FF3B2|nr:hypothetical protein [Priestia filamentosa]